MKALWLWAANKYCTKSHSVRNTDNVATMPLTVKPLPLADACGNYLPVSDSNRATGSSALGRQAQLSHVTAEAITSVCKSNESCA